MTTLSKAQEHPLMVPATAVTFTMPDGKSYEFTSTDGGEKYFMAGTSKFFDAAQFARAKENARGQGAEFYESTGWMYK